MIAGFCLFEVDVNAICDRPVFGPLWYEYAKETKQPTCLSAPTHMLPDGHPRKPKRQIGKCLFRVLGNTGGE